MRGPRANGTSRLRSDGRRSFFADYLEKLPTKAFVPEREDGHLRTMGEDYVAGGRMPGAWPWVD